MPAKQMARPLSTAQRNRLPDRDFAFTRKRKEPLNDADHVRSAIRRFEQVTGVSDAERDAAWKKIKAAARKHDIEMSHSSWRELFEDGKPPRK
jgi:hypothetical protein